MPLLVMTLVACKSTVNVQNSSVTANNELKQNLEKKTNFTSATSSSEAGRQAITKYLSHEFEHKEIIYSYQNMWPYFFLRDKPEGKMLSKGLEKIFNNVTLVEPFDVTEVLVTDATWKIHHESPFIGRKKRNEKSLDGYLSFSIINCEGQTRKFSTAFPTDTKFKESKREKIAKDLANRISKQSKEILAFIRAGETTCLQPLIGGWLSTQLKSGFINGFVNPDGTRPISKVGKPNHLFSEHISDFIYLIKRRADYSLKPFYVKTTVNGEALSHINISLTALLHSVEVAKSEIDSKDLLNVYFDNTAIISRTGATDNNELLRDVLEGFIHEDLDPLLIEWAFELELFDPRTTFLRFPKEFAKSKYDDVVRKYESQNYSFSVESVRQALVRNDKNYIRAANSAGFPFWSEESKNTYDLIFESVIDYKKRKSLPLLAEFTDFNRPIRLSDNSYTRLLHTVMPSVLDEEGSEVTRKLLPGVYINLTSKASMELVDLLISMGANPALTDSEGRTAEEDYRYRVASQIAKIEQEEQQSIQKQAEMWRAIEASRKRNIEAYERMMGAARQSQDIYQQQSRSLDRSIMPRWKQKMLDEVDNYAYEQKTVKRSMSNSKESHKADRSSSSVSTNRQAAAMDKVGSLVSPESWGYMECQFFTQPSGVNTNKMLTKWFSGVYKIWGSYEQDETGATIIPKEELEKQSKKNTNAAVNEMRHLANQGGEIALDVSCNEFYMVSFGWTKEEALHNRNGRLREANEQKDSWGGGSRMIVIDSTRGF